MNSGVRIMVSTTATTMPMNITNVGYIAKWDISEPIL